VLTAGIIHHIFFDPSFAENQPCMAPRSQWNSSLPMQCCLLDSYRRVKVVDSCLLCSCGCQWLLKLCWQLESSITDVFWPKFFWKPILNGTTDPVKLFLAHVMLFVGSIWKSKSGWFLFVMSLWLSVATEIVLTAGIHHLSSGGQKCVQPHLIWKPIKKLFVC
jgi:hypothetical protein